jgi:hypothetical protein
MQAYSAFRNPLYVSTVNAINDSSSAIALSKNCGSPKGIAIAPTTLIAVSTAVTGLNGIHSHCAAFQLKRFIMLTINNTS